MKNNNRGGDGGLNREGGLLTFFPLKREGGAYYWEGAYLRGGLRGFTMFSQKKCVVNKVANFKDFLRHNKEICTFQGP